MKKNSQNGLDKLWHLFASIKFAVTLLIIIAVTSIIGTLIPQNASDQVYIHNFGQTGFTLMSALKLTDMYHSFWFLGLLVLLCVCIVVCSIERLGSTYKIIFPKSITCHPSRFRNKNPFQQFSLEKDLATAALTCETVCARAMKTVLSQDTETGRVFYGEKGRWTRLGVYVVHLSIIFLLIGGVVGGIGGFKGNMRLDIGETGDIVILPRENTGRQLPFKIRCDDFAVKFYDSGMPEEFRSALTIIEDSREVLKKDIIVNRPLRYKGINIFQASYGVTAPGSALFSVQSNESGMVFDMTVKKGASAPLPEDSGTFVYEGFMSNFNFRGHNIGDVFVCTLNLRDAEPVQTIIPVRFPTFDKMRKGRFTVSVADFEPSYYTGLQITKDPGVWYVYAGFALMIIGCWITFLMSHQVLFIELVPEGQHRTGVLVWETASKNRQGMKIKTNKIIRQIKGNS